MEDSRTDGVPGFGTVLGAALGTGIVGGVLFTIRDCVRVLLGRELEGPSRAASWLLRFGLDALFWYTLAACLLMVVCGAAIWLLTRVGHRFAGPRLVAVCAGLLTFVTVSVALLFLHDLALGQSAISLEEVWPLAEIALLAALTACGVGTLIVQLREKLPQPGRLLAWVLGASVALFLLAFGLVWINLGSAASSSSTKTLLGHTLLLVVVVTLGRGAYLAAWSLSDAAERRRRAARGAKLLLVGALVWSGAAYFVHVRAERDKAEELKEKPGGAKGRPNVLWLVLDSTRADTFSCYGSPRKTTPYLDQLALEGTLYERAYATSSWTVPSHASMFTGLLPSRHRTTAESQRLDRDHTTIAELLAAAGYDTYSYSNNEHISKEENLTHGFDTHLTYFCGRAHKADLLLGQIREHLRLADYGARDANAAVRGWIADSVEAGRPFFVFINYMEIHSRYGSTPAWRRFVDPRVSLATVRSLQHYQPVYAIGRADRSPERCALMRALYDGDATYLDARIHELIEFLRASGVLDDTLVIVTSDHGEEFNEHKLIGHGFGVYNSMLHVPLIVRYPKRFKAGARVDRLVSLMDLFPTVLDVTGTEWEGRSSLEGRTLFDEGGGPRALVAEKAMPMRWIRRDIMTSGHPRLPELYRRLRCIQDGEYKYIWADDGQDELYHVAEDPTEQVNLIHDLPEKARDLKAALAGRVGGLPPYPLRPKKVAKPDKGE